MTQDELLGYTIRDILNNHPDDLENYFTILIKNIMADPTCLVNCQKQMIADKQKELSNLNNAVAITTAALADLNK